MPQHGLQVGLRMGECVHGLRAKLNVDKRYDS